MLELRPVIETLPAGFDAMRAEAVAEGHGFIERLATDWRSGATRFDREGETLLAATVAGVLAGTGGRTIDPIVPGALRMRRFYVRQAFRRGGIGRKLAARLLDEARRTGCPITVNAAPESVPFWESLGFRPDECDGHTHVLDRQWS